MRTVVHLQEERVHKRCASPGNNARRFRMGHLFSEGFLQLKKICFCTTVPVFCSRCSLLWWCLLFTSTRAYDHQHHCQTQPPGAMLHGIEPSIHHHGSCCTVYCLAMILCVYVYGPSTSIQGAQKPIHVCPPCLKRRKSRVRFRI